MIAHRVPRGVVLAALCLAVLAINVDTTIVNVALPTLTRELQASTRELQWIVDAYNLLFAALVLAGGTLGDRFGRRRLLVMGLAVFGAGAGAAVLAETSTALIGLRAVMGVGAALVFPATLSIATTLYTDPRGRATAIGAWGATAGVGVALGPVVGGWLLEHHDWSSIFTAMAPVAVLAAALALVVVPDSRDPSAPPLDVPGAVLSTLAIAAVVVTIIESPERGWLGPFALVGWAVGLALLAAFVVRERRVAHPMLDLALFRNRRFSAASGAIAAAFFALFGFIFLVTQYLQFLLGYSPLQTGVRMLPVALALGASAVVAPRLALRLGTKAVVAGGLSLLAVAYAWISTLEATTPYVELAGQMVLLGVAMGLATAAATESIMGAVPGARAGVGAATNDATRELGGTLGVAVVGSVYASQYAADLARPYPDEVPFEAVDLARESFGTALLVIERMKLLFTPESWGPLRSAAVESFVGGLQAGALVASGVSAVAALGALVLLPARPPAEADADRELGEELARGVAALAGTPAAPGPGERA